MKHSERVLILGHGPMAEKVVEAVESAGPSPYLIVGMLDESAARVRAWAGSRPAGSPRA